MELKVKAKYLIIAASMATACNNYSLLDKLKDPSGGSSSSESLYAFASSSNTIGDLSGYVAGIFSTCASFNFTDRADCACQIMATNANLTIPASGKYIAWLSSTTNDMSCRIQGKTGINCGIPSGGPQWKNLNNDVFASSYSALFGGTLAHPLNMTETKSITSATFIWTGTTTTGLAAGTATANTCNEWAQTTSVNGTVGTPGAQDANWTAATTTQACGSSGAIYCFGKPQ